MFGLKRRALCWTLIFKWDTDRETSFAYKTVYATSLHTDGLLAAGALLPSSYIASLPASVIKLFMNINTFTWYNIMLPRDG